MAPNQNSYTESYINEPFVYVDAEYKKKFFQHRLFFPNCFKFVCTKFKSIHNNFFLTDNGTFLKDCIFFNVNQLTLINVSTCIDFENLAPNNTARESHNVLLHALPNEHNQCMTYVGYLGRKPNQFLMRPIPLALVYCLYQSLINPRSLSFRSENLKMDTNTGFKFGSEIIKDSRELTNLRGFGIKHISFFELIVGILSDPYIPKK